MTAFKTQEMAASTRITRSQKHPPKKTDHPAKPKRVFKLPVKKHNDSSTSSDVSIKKNDIKISKTTQTLKDHDINTKDFEKTANKVKHDIENSPGTEKKFDTLNNFLDTTREIVKNNGDLKDFLSTVKKLSNCGCNMKQQMNTINSVNNVSGGKHLKKYLNAAKNLSQNNPASADAFSKQISSALKKQASPAGFESHIRLSFKLVSSNINSSYYSNRISGSLKDAYGDINKDKLDRFLSLLEKLLKDRDNPDDILESLLKNLEKDNKSGDEKSNNYFMDRFGFLHDIKPVKMDLRIQPNSNGGKGRSGNDTVTRNIGNLQLRIIGSSNNSPASKTDDVNGLLDQLASSIEKGLNSSKPIQPLAPVMGSAASFSYQSLDISVHQKKVYYM